MTVHEITFVTGNANKLATATRHLAPLGITVHSHRSDLDEIQSTHVSDVAVHKARQAHALLGGNVMVEDSGFGIDEFDGWPGCMIKQTLAALGPAGICHLADLTATRKSRFTSAVAYVDATGTTHVFMGDDASGTIATTPTTAQDPDAWSALWSVFIPGGTTTPLSALSSAERERQFAQWERESGFTRLGAMLSEQASSPTMAIQSHDR